MKRSTIVFLILLIALSIFLIANTGCQKSLTPPLVSETSCQSDSDCACGTHKDTGECFLGNKAFVNTEKQCPDFCTGIDGRFRTKCIEGECQHVRLQPAAECITDSDCVQEQCCHATSCIPVEKKGVCTLLCTNVCLPGTLDCGGSCTCENGKCKANIVQ